MNKGTIELKLHSARPGESPRYLSANGGWLLMVDRENIQSEDGRLPERIEISVWVSSD